MLAVYLSPLYLLINGYLLWRLIHWMGACHHFFKKKAVRAGIVALYLFFALALLVGFFLPPGSLQRFFKSVGNYWIGVLLYGVLSVAIAELIRLIIYRFAKSQKERLQTDRAFAVAGGIVAVVILVMSLWGVVNARIVHTTPYEVKVAKDGGKFEELNVVLAADLHLGYNIGCRQTERIVEKINRQDADLVVLAGDIFDNEYEALEDPEELAAILRSIKSRYGVYACYGNHDIQEKILAGFTFGKKGEKKMSDPRMDRLLEDAGITLLQDEQVLIEDSLYLYGRPDAKKPGRGIEKRKEPEEITKEMNKEKPILVMDHEPSQLQELAEAGVDVDLCGHTHDGQLFPGNLLMGFIWENPCGYLQKGKMHNIVTSGAGLFGPNMRVGTKAEICAVHIVFQPEHSK